MIERVADAGLRGEMDDALGPLLGKDRLDHLTVGKVRLDEMESVAALEPPKTGLFERDIVIRAHIVEPDDLVAAVEQPGRSVETDEAGGAGNQNAHVAVLYPSLLSQRARPQEPSALCLSTGRVGNASS